MKIGRIIYWVATSVIAVIALMLIVSVLPITGNLKFFVVQSGSMEPAIKTGSIVVVKPVKEYKIGDIITFTTNNNKSPITHRIAELKMIDGQVVYITKGDANNSPDSELISKERIIGKVRLSVPYLGYVVDFTKKPIGFMLIILIPAITIAAGEIKKIFQELKKIKSQKNKS